MESGKLKSLLGRRRKAIVKMGMINCESFALSEYN